MTALDLSHLPSPPNRRASAQTLRRQLADAVERALALLDALDGDPDLEDQCEDEGAQCDDEGVCKYLDPDSEPDLGAPEHGHGGSRWGAGVQSHAAYLGVADGEEDHRSRADRVKGWKRAKGAGCETGLLSYRPRPAVKKGDRPLTLRQIEAGRF